MLSFRVFAATYHRLLFSLPNLVAARPPLPQNSPLSHFDFPFSSTFFIIRTYKKRGGGVYILQAKSLSCSPSCPWRHSHFCLPRVPFRRSECGHSNVQTIFDLSLF